VQTNMQIHSSETLEVKRSQGTTHKSNCRHTRSQSSKTLLQHPGCRVQNSATFQKIQQMKAAHHGFCPLVRGVRKFRPRREDDPIVQMPLSTVSDCDVKVLHRQAYKIHPIIIQNASYNRIHKTPLGTTNTTAA
jgi:hypothetical protein